MIQLWMLASGSGDFIWRSIASIELVVVITLLAIALNPLAEYDAYRALSEMLGIGNLRVASTEALGRIFRGRRRGGDLALAWYKVLGFAYMVLVLIVLTNLLASFLRRASVHAGAAQPLHRRRARHRRLGRVPGAPSLVPRSGRDASRISRFRPAPHSWCTWDLSRLPAHACCATTSRLVRSDGRAPFSGLRAGPVRRRLLVRAPCAAAALGG